MRVKNHRKIKAAPASLFNLGFRQAEAIRRKYTAIHFGYENDVITSVDARNYRFLKPLGEFHAEVPFEYRKKTYIELAEFLAGGALGETYLVIDDPHAITLFNNDVLSLNLDGTFFFLRANDFLLMKRRQEYMQIDTEDPLDDIGGKVAFGMDAEEEYFSHERKEALMAKPSPDALEVCAYIQNMLKMEKRDIKWLRFNTTPGYLVDCSCRFSFLTFKVAKDGKKYIVAPSDIAEKSGLPYTERAISDGAARVYFASPMDLEALHGYICGEFDKAYANLQKVLTGRNVSYASQFNTIAHFYQMQEAEVKKHMAAIPGKDYGEPHVPRENTVTKNDVKIKATASRQPISDIDPLVPEREKEAQSLLKKADEARRQGSYDESIALLEESRNLGCRSHELYLSFSRTYHAMHDFENEVIILEEGVSVLEKDTPGMFAKRLSRALQSLAREQKRQQEKQEKAARLDRKKQGNDGKTTASKRPARRVVKVDQEGNVLETYDSVKEAAGENGIKLSTLYAVVQPGNKRTVLQCMWSYEDDIS